MKIRLHDVTELRIQKLNDIERRAPAPGDQFREIGLGDYR